jgi:hypothetical protein
VVHENEDLEERTEPFLHGAGLFQIGDEDSSTELVGFTVSLPGRLQ